MKAARTELGQSMRGWSLRRAVPRSLACLAQPLQFVDAGGLVMKVSRSIALAASPEQLWNLAFWASIMMCEVVGLLLTQRA
jgi:hypothetical protein